MLYRDELLILHSKIDTLKKSVALYESAIYKFFIDTANLDHEAKDNLAREFTKAYELNHPKDENGIEE